jgi:hypothetical protein
MFLEDYFNAIKLLEDYEVSDPVELVFKTFPANSTHKLHEFYNQRPYVQFGLPPTVYLRWLDGIDCKYTYINL